MILVSTLIPTLPLKRVRQHTVSGHVIPRQQPCHHDVGARGWVRAVVLFILEMGWLHI